jgi:tetratricopeptide (TPR) repeat protein
MRNTTRILVLALLVALPALADDPPALVARQHYQRGTALFNLGEWDEAAAEYKEAYKALPEPVFLYNIAQAYRLAGDLPKAAFFYNSYAHNAKDPATKKEAELRAKKLEAMIASGQGQKRAEHKAEPKPEARVEAKTEIKGEPPASQTALIAPLESAAGETPGPEWSGGSERLGSMTDLIKSHRDQFRFCYDAWSKKHPKVDTKLKLILTLNPDGKLQTAEAQLADLKAPELERCIVAMSKQLTYPPSANGKMTRFTYPFDFKYRPN